jgi:hypothetical protein
MPSTALSDIAYDPAARTLDVTFVTSGRRYRYFDVLLDEYDALLRAASRGAHFNRVIKPNHDYMLLFDRPAKPPRRRGPFLRP